MLTDLELVIEYYRKPCEDLASPSSTTPKPRTLQKFLRRHCRILSSCHLPSTQDELTEHLELRSEMVRLFALMKELITTIRLKEKEGVDFYLKYGSLADKVFWKRVREGAEDRNRLRKEIGRTAQKIRRLLRCRPWN